MILGTDLFRLARIVNLRTASHDGLDSAAALPDAALRAVTAPDAGPCSPATARSWIQPRPPPAPVRCCRTRRWRSCPAPADAAPVAARIRRFLDVHTTAVEPG